MRQFRNSPMMMGIAVRISESQAALGKEMVSSVLIEPDVRPVLDPIRWRTSGSGH
jgi:hypothetical protein